MYRIAGRELELERLEIKQARVGGEWRRDLASCGWGGLMDCRRMERSVMQLREARQKR